MLDPHKEGRSGREVESSRIRVWALAQALRAHGFVVEVAESEPLLVLVGESGALARVRCEVRDDCGGELWFRSANGVMLAPADDAHLHEAVVVVKGLAVPDAGA